MLEVLECQGEGRSRLFLLNNLEPAPYDHVVDVRVTRVEEQKVEVGQLIPQERISEHIEEQTARTVQPETHSELIPAARKIEFESCK